MKNRHFDLTNSIYFKILLLWIVLVLSSCNTKEKTKTENQAEVIVDADVITISESQFHAGQMELGKISMEEFNTVVKANGMFAVPPQNQVDVSAYYAGYVKNIKWLPGDEVKKGQELFTIENPEYVQIQQDFLEAKGQLNYLKSDYERQKELLANNISSKKNFLKAESEYAVTHARHQSLKKKLSLMNINHKTLSVENIRSVIAIRSPLSGYITRINASNGMYLNPSDVALTVTNTDDLHVELKIFEKDLLLIKKEQLINIRLQNNSDRVYQGKVHLINKTIDAQDRTLELHGDLVNKSEAKLFVPGMYVEAEIVTSSTEQSALPSEAVANIENDFFVLVKEDEQVYRKVLVKIGTTQNGFTQILNAEDFTPNTTFLTKGTFNLLTE